VNFPFTDAAAAVVVVATTSSFPEPIDILAIPGAQVGWLDLLPPMTPSFEMRFTGLDCSLRSRLTDCDSSSVDVYSLPFGKVGAEGAGGRNEVDLF